MQRAADFNRGADRRSAAGRLLSPSDGDDAAGSPAPSSSAAPSPARAQPALPADPQPPPSEATPPLAADSLPDSALQPQPAPRHPAQSAPEGEGDVPGASASDGQAAVGAGSPAEGRAPAAGTSVAGGPSGAQEGAAAPDAELPAETCVLEPDAEGRADGEPVPAQVAVAEDALEAGAPNTEPSEPAQGSGLGEQLFTWRPSAAPEKAHAESSSKGAGPDRQRSAQARPQLLRGVAGETALLPALMRQVTRMPWPRLGLLVAMLTFL